MTSPVAAESSKPGEHAGSATARTRASWAGSTMAQRQAQRREKLISTAIDLLAESGGPGLSVRAVCRRSGVTERYFYENFTDRDDLARVAFSAVADRVNEAIVQAVAHSPRDPREVAQAAVDAVLDEALGTPAGRVLFVAPAADPLLGAMMQERGSVLAELIEGQLPASQRRELVTTSLVGALGRLFAQFVDGTLRLAADPVEARTIFSRHCVDLLVTVAALNDVPR